MRNRIAEVNDLLNPLVEAAQPGLVSRRSAVAGQLAGVETELNELRPLVARADQQPLGTPAVNRDGATFIDARQLGRDIQGLNQRRAALLDELTSLDTQLAGLTEKLRPDLAARQTALNGELRGLLAKRSDVTDVIARLIGSGDYEAAIEVNSNLMRQRQVLSAELDQVLAQIGAATDPSQRQSLQRRAAELQVRFNDLSEEYFQVGKYIGRQQDQFELDWSAGTARRTEDAGPREWRSGRKHCADHAGR